VKAAGIYPLAHFLQFGKFSLVTSPKEFPLLIQGRLFTVSGMTVSKAQGLMVVTTLD